MVCIIKDIPTPSGIEDIVEIVEEKCEKFELVDEGTESEIKELDQNNTIVEQLLQERRHLETPVGKSINIEGEKSILQGDTSLSNEIDFESINDNTDNTRPTKDLADNSLSQVEGSVTTEKSQTSGTENTDIASSSLNNNSENLVIIDNIKESWKFRNSTNIKREFSRYFKQEKLVLAYSLKAGGIALHLDRKEAADRVLKYSWPAEAFNYSGSQLSCHRPSNKPKLILKNIDTYLSESEIEEIIQNFTTEKVSARRLHYRDTGKPLPVVKITCTENVCQQLLAKYFNINGRELFVEKYQTVHRREITCFNCREKGHIARSCTQLLAVSQL